MQIHIPGEGIMFGQEIRARRRAIRPLLAVSLAMALVLSSASPAAASAGELDDTFDGNGKLLVNLSPNIEFAADVAIQTDQKIVVVGASYPDDGEWVVLRFNPDGTPDSSFGGGTGRVSFDFSAVEDFPQAVAIQADGRIVVVGLAGAVGGQWGIARLTEVGTLDQSFSQDGKVVRNFSNGFDIANDVAIQSDQKIVVVGQTGHPDSRFTVARYDSAGALDPSFSNDGIASANLTNAQDLPFGIGLTSTGKIVAAGYASGSGGQVGLVRFKTTGVLDNTFSGDGMVKRNLTGNADSAIGVAIQSADGKVVLSGISGGANSRMEALRYNVDGTPDNTFSGDGRMSIDITPFTDSANSLAIQGDGSIVLGGHANFDFFTVVRLTPTGSLDAAFGDDGVMFSNLTPDYDVIYSVAIQADGGIVAAGISSGQGGRMSLARFLGS